MDPDALDSLDTQLPPRHALESDEEDEFNPLTKQESTPPSANVSILGDIPAQRNLIVATGDPGAFWARGASLGEQTGAVAVNGVQVGLVFNPPWTQANVIISEALTSLPVWAMHPYAQTTINTLRPTSVSLLDEYALPTYITNSPSPRDDPPIRYLSTSAFDPTGQAQPFAPPNLISTTSAAFLSLLSVSQILGILFLLPSPSIPRPPPRTLEPSNIARLSSDTTEWSSKLMNNAQQLLFRAVNEPTDQQWQLTDEPSSSSPKPSTASHKSEIGEGGMYI